MGDAYYRLYEKKRAVEAWKAGLQAELSKKQADTEMVKRLQKKLQMVESKQRPPVAWSIVDRLEQTKPAATQAAGQSSK